VLSLIIPLYKSEPNLERLLAELLKLGPDPLEVVFVVDGSPDRCHEILSARLPALPLRSQLVDLSRNFGSFAAIAAGLAMAKGDHYAVLAADLQEPPELALEFSRILQAGEADVVFGVRASRSDPWLSEMAAGIFWAVYRRLVLPDIPPGGVDVFGCNRMVRDRLLDLPEARTNLIALLFWMGFRRKFVPYHRQPRREGASAWTMTQKLRYSIDSIFDFTDLPVRLLLWAGVLGTLFALIGAAVVLWAKLRGDIAVPGYTPIVLAVMFFGGVTTFGLGIIGQYLWLALANARRRPNFIIRDVREFGET
jgi:polyisoprenyl-phosphate glycosyltransferase